MKNLLEPKSLLDVRKWKDSAATAISKDGMKGAHDKALNEFADVVERIRKHHLAKRKAA